MFDAVSKDVGTLLGIQAACVSGACLAAMSHQKVYARAIEWSKKLGLSEKEETQVTACMYLPTGCDLTETRLISHKQYFVDVLFNWSYYHLILFVIVISSPMTINGINTASQSSSAHVLT